MKVAGYISPDTLDEAVAVLAEDPAARPLAGGNSLLVEPNRSRLSNVKLIDLAKIPGLVGIQSQGGSLRIGSMTPLAAIAADPGITQAYPAVAEATSVTGDAQVRNRATIGGTLADSHPAADLPAVMLAIAVRINVYGPHGSRVLSPNELIVGPFRTSLERGELITSVDLPAVVPGSGSAYEKFRHPATLFAIVGVAASVTVADGEGMVGCEVALTGGPEFPTRLAAVSALAAQQPDGAEFAATAEHLADHLTFRGDRFASAEYRRHLSGVLMQRAVRRAVERARHTVQH